jgi:hypothetical protein
MREASRKIVSLLATKIVHEFACILHFKRLVHPALLCRQQRQTKAKNWVRLNALNPDRASGKAKESFTAINGKLVCGRLTTVWLRSNLRSSLESY